MKRQRLYSPISVRYATVAVIIAGAITLALGVRDSVAFEGVRPTLIIGVILVLAGAVLLGLTYTRAAREFQK